jgi:hypothetical protein
VAVCSITWLDVRVKNMLVRNDYSAWLGIALRFLASSRDHRIEEGPCSVASALRQLARPLKISGGDLALN